MRAFRNAMVVLYPQGVMPPMHMLVMTMMADADACMMVVAALAAGDSSSTLPHDRDGCKQDSALDEVGRTR
jgi:hypothetical protein